MSEIPEKCLNCPSVKRVQGVIEMHEQQVASMLDQLVSDDLDAQAEHLFEEYPEEVRQTYGVSTPKELVEMTRRTGSQQLEILEAHNDTHRVELAQIVLGCLGAVELQGSNDDTRVTVTVCASPEIARDEGAGEETVLVNRQSIT
jgi:hypothetical protein